MESSDPFSSSTAPLTWHDFIDRMRQPSAADLVKDIKSFVVSFLNNAPDGERDAERDSAAVQEFLGKMEAAFRAHSLWAGSSDEKLESAGEGLEKYVMTKLYSHVFASIPEDVKADEQLHEKMALVQQFIRPENLDIKPTYQNETSWLLAQKELQKINMYKAPRDKLVCILNCCKVISNLLLNASLASNDEHPGADEFLPVLIFVTIKANPPQLHSNLAYIQRFRRETRLVGEAAYFFTNMLSVESFITDINAKALSMDEAEYERNIESAQALLSGLSDSSDNLYNQADQNFGHVSQRDSVESKPNMTSKRHQHSLSQPHVPVESSEAKSGTNDSGKDQSSLDKIPSISDLENKGAGMLLKENEASRLFKEFPYLYCQAGDLRVGDVDDLLNNYKQLVFKYVCLARGLGVNTSLLITNPSGQIIDTPSIAKESEKRSDSNPYESPQGRNLDQPEITKDSHNGSESMLNADAEGRNLEQPEITKETENRSEADLNDNKKDDLSTLVDISEGSNFRTESSKSEGQEEVTRQTEGEEDDKIS